MNTVKRQISTRLSGRSPENAWLSIQVELIEGRGKHFWPRPGRVFAAAVHDSFADLATAIDYAFARWDRSHGHEFAFARGVHIGRPDPDADEPIVNESRTRLSRLQPKEQFVYIYDFGDYWAHLCTVGEYPIDPLETLGIVPDRPLPYFGWGDLPDQYGRRWRDDDGDAKAPPDPRLRDLPPLQPGWGSRRT